jgi:SPP1 gp7 family putative phage head morphogenesis protein
MDFTTLSLLPDADIIHLKNASKAAQAIEDFWARRVTSLLEGYASEALKKLEENDALPKEFALDGLEELLTEHSFDVSYRAIRIAEGNVEPFQPIYKRFSVYPKPVIPNSLRQLMKLYDLWRRGKYSPKRPKKQALVIQKQYLKKVTSVWEKHSADFRSGNIATQDLVVKKIQQSASTTASRARNIVRTETTNYYNKARKDYYDESVDITHYLFIAIRDAGTSPWCTPLTIDGYRGRSGLVYSKDDPLLAKEMPSCHPGCRSEIVPLNRLNPAHLRFIQNEEIQRRAHTCFPLLKGWHAA